MRYDRYILGQILKSRRAAQCAISRSLMETVLHGHPAQCAICRRPRAKGWDLAPKWGIMVARYRNIRTRQRGYVWKHFTGSNDVVRPGFRHLFHVKCVIRGTKRTFNRQRTSLAQLAGTKQGHCEAAPRCAQHCLSTKRLRRDEYEGLRGSFNGNSLVFVFLRKHSTLQHWTRVHHSSFHLTSHHLMDKVLDATATSLAENPTAGTGASNGFSLRQKAIS